MEQTRSAHADFVRGAVGQFERPLTTYAAHLLGGDVERARDLVQETFFRLCHQPRERTEPFLREWLYTVCRNLAVDFRRKDRRMQWTGEAPEQYARSDDGPLEAIERQDSYRQVLALLGTLSPNQQEVVRLKFQHGMSYKQISEVTDLSVTNVGFLLHAALKALRQKLENPRKESSVQR